MKVSGVTMVILVLNMLIGIAIPLGLAIFFRKKYRCPLVPFWAGCGVMFLSAFVLEQIVHTVVLSSPAGNLIRGNFWLMALYGGVMAGLFEETGRLLGMKFLLKKYHDNDDNALMYGAGHGGIEAFLILGMSSMSNLLTAAMINGGLMEKTMTALEPAQQEVTYHQLSVLWTTPAYQFYLAPVERISAIALQIALSILVYSAVKTGRKLHLAAAFGLHFAVDFLTVVCASTIPTWALELGLLMVVAVICVAVYKLAYVSSTEKKA